MKPSQAHLDTAQRIYDRLGRGSVADIDAIAQALAEAERGGERKGIREGKRQAAEKANAWADDLSPFTGYRIEQIFREFASRVSESSESE